jgi:hypothetical protein
MLETEKELQKFVKYVVQQSRSNLTKLKKNSSKKLYDSLKGESKLFKNSFGVYFSMEDYGHYQDKGVNGVGPAGKDKNGNPKKVVRDGKYSYTSKGGIRGLKGMPPTSKLDNWIVRKGIAPRNKEGKFISRQTLKFLIARSIFRHGIKPSLFFTKPFEKAFSVLPSELIEKYGLDAISLFNSTIEQPKAK